MQTVRLSSAAYSRLLALACRLGQNSLLLPAAGSGVNADLCGNLSLGGVRHKHSKRVNVRVQRKMEDGIQYHGFKYFPRFPDQKDPPYEPSKLFMVKRIRSLKRIPWFEKDVITTLGLDRRCSTAIIKNTPNNNARLYKVKHLIEINPITTPYGMPDSPELGFLKENGQFVATKDLPGSQPQLQLEEGKKVNEVLLKKSVDGETLKKRLRLNWFRRW